MGLEPIKAIAHRLEALFKAFYSESVVIDGELESQLLRAFDCLRLPLTQQLAEGAFDGDQALALAEPVLQTLEQRLAGAIAETENFIPSSSDLGFDMATAIFEVDVQQGLYHLTRLLEQPEAQEMAGVLRAQAKIFMGFAELLDLSGFALIAQTAIQALALNPAQAVEITPPACGSWKLVTASRRYKAIAIVFMRSPSTLPSNYWPAPTRIRRSSSLTLMARSLVQQNHS